MAQGHDEWDTYPNGGGHRKHQSSSWSAGKVNHQAPSFPYLEAEPGEEVLSIIKEKGAEDHFHTVDICKSVAPNGMRGVCQGSWLVL